jgi:site-specific DNA-methyltransferase (cytosine-N4-specific)
LNGSKHHKIDWKKKKMQMTNSYEIITGKALETCQTLETASVDSIITSPPYWQLRDYGFSEQWGLEPTFQEYLEHLWSLMDELWRVLKPEGTAWINLGDTFGTQSGGLKGKETFDPKNPKATLNVIEQPKTIHKCLLLIPHRFAIGCIDCGWILRNDIVWAKPNGMPESVTDRFSKKHEYFFFFAKQPKYFFDLDAVRDETAVDSIKRKLRGNSDQAKYQNGKGLPQTMSAPTMSAPRDYVGYANLDQEIENNKGKNPGDVADFWAIPTKGSSADHYAAYNSALIDKPIQAGCPVGGIILDPFAGTAETGVAALRLGRRFIGIEGNPKTADDARQRLQVFTAQGTLF